MSGVRHSTHVTIPDDPLYAVGSDEWNAGHATDETDTSLVLKPDGHGGVEFGPQSGSPLTVTDGTTSVTDVTTLTTVGATVTDGGAGEAIVTVNPYAGTTPETPIALAPVDYLLSSTVESLPIAAHTYSDGVGGVGATLTEDNAADGGLFADGTILSNGQRIVFYDGGGLNTGIYDVTEAGDGLAVPWVLTRSTDCDTPSKRCRFWSVGVLAGVNFTLGMAYPVWFDLGSGSIDLGIAALFGRAFGYSTAADRASLAAGEGAITRALGAIALGSYVTALNDAGVATGRQTISYGTGQRAHSSGKVGMVLPQITDQTYANQTTDATPTVLITYGGSPFVFLARIAGAWVADYAKTCVVRGRIIARRLGTPGTDAAWDFAGVIRGDGVSAYSWIGGSDPVPAVIAQDAAASTWAVAVTISGASIVVTVTGEVGKTIDWMSTLELDEVN